MTDRDILTNLPYVENAYLVFDHHLSEVLRNKDTRENHIIQPDAPSAARVVYDYYGGKKKLPKISTEMMEAVDKGDSANFELKEVLHPEGWVLMNFIMDSRTGLGRFRTFRISNYNLMMDLIEYCKTHTIDQILDLPDVKERLILYTEQSLMFREQIRLRSKVHKNLILVDLREETLIHAGNRFIKYAVHPECNISLQIMWGKGKLNTVFSVGASIFNRTSNTNIGELMLKYGGGGHRNAGTCQVPNDQAPKVMNELIKIITENG